MMERPVSIRASQSGNCPRRFQLAAQGVSGLPPWEGMERAYAEGNMHERDILDWAAANIEGGGWKVTAKQKELLIHEDNTLRITGHIDGELTAKNKGRYLVECKALSRRGYQELVRNGVAVAHPQYMAQVQLYLHGTQFYPWAKTNTAFLVARDKETPRNRLWDHYVERIPYDPEAAIAIIEGLAEIALNIIEGREIDPPYNPEDDWRCRPPWCPYTYVCHPGYRREVETVKKADELATLVNRRQEIDAQLQELKKEHEEITEIIKASLDDGEYAVGDWMVTIKTSVAERIDTKLVRSLIDPELLPQVLKITQQRSLRITGL